jgi:hypothetical protein
VISIFPNDSETFVIPESSAKVLGRISNELQKPFTGIRGETLTGSLHGPRFLLTIQLRRQHLFMPVVNGSVEETSKGSIVFMKYSLFPGTRLLLLFWTVILTIAGGYISYQSRDPWLFAGSIALLIFFYVIAWANFRLHVKTSQKIIYKILSWADSENPG